MAPADRHDRPAAGRAETTALAGRQRFAVVIPVYNHAGGVLAVISGAHQLGFPVIVVDDGSTDATGDRIRDAGGILAMRHSENRGKGAALLTGFAEAAKIADWAITIDADGQHYPPDALKMIAAIPENRRPIVIGRRQGMDSGEVPWTSRFGRGFSNFWVRCAGGPALADSQSGFRIYPLPEALRLPVVARRFQFEIEILVRAAWQKIPVIEVPVAVSYARGAERVSHFRPFMDFWRNACTFARLITRRVLLHPFSREP